MEEREDEESIDDNESLPDLLDDPVINDPLEEKITTERTIVEDLEVTGASQSQLGMYIMIIILRFRKLRLVCPVPGSLKFP